VVILSGIVIVVGRLCVWFHLDFIAFQMILDPSLKSYTSECH